MGCRVGGDLSEVELVTAEGEETSEAKEEDSDARPDHAAGNEPHKDDPDKGENAGTLKGEVQYNHEIYQLIQFKVVPRRPRPIIQ